jgi:hypothetical protein
MEDEFCKPLGHRLQGFQRVRHIGFQLHFYAESLNTFGSRHLEINKISYLKLQRFSPLIRIAFLSGLGCFKIGLNSLDLIFGFDN